MTPLGAGTVLPGVLGPPLGLGLPSVSRRVVEGWGWKQGKTWPETLASQNACSDGDVGGAPPPQRAPCLPSSRDPAEAKSCDLVSGTGSMCSPLTSKTAVGAAPCTPSLWVSVVKCLPLEGTPCFGRFLGPTWAESGWNGKANLGRRVWGWGWGRPSWDLSPRGMEPLRVP